MNVRSLLKAVVVIAALFIAYMWSGGIYVYHFSKDGGSIRVNKITNKAYLLTFDEEKRVHYWLDADSVEPVEKEEPEPAPDPAILPCECEKRF